MPVLTQTSAHDTIIRAAQDVPTLLAGLAVIDPALSQQLTGKPLVRSTAPIGPVAGLAVGWFVEHFGLACTTTVTSGCWTDSTKDAVSAVIVLICTAIGAYVGRCFASAPISGLLHNAPPAPPDPVAALAAMQAASAAAQPPPAAQPGATT